MRKNNLGFTMVELLAAIVVLGILMGSAVPIVINVMNEQKRDLYIQDALRLASNAEYKLRSDNKLDIPGRGACIAINLTYMDNNAFEKAPYGGEYDRLASFVLAHRNTRSEQDASGEEYKFYVRLVEKTESGAYRGVNLINYNNLYASNARNTYVSNMSEAQAQSLSYYKANVSALNSVIAASDQGIVCSGIIFVAPDEYE